MVELGEAREEWARDVWNKAEDIANQMSSEDRPFYIVYACKQDRSEPHKFYQAFKMYRERPPAILGALVWYVDHPHGIFRLESELSLPPDVPIDPNLLSTKSEDQFSNVMELGQKNNVLLS